MDMINKINEGYAGLTRKQKMIADYMLNNIEKMSFSTLKELSEELGVTEVTILHACSALGFESFNEVKYESRKYISLMEKVNLHREMSYTAANIPKGDLKNHRKLLFNIIDEEARQAKEYAEEADIEELFEAAEMFLSKRKIILCGRGISKILAESMAIHLAGVNIASTVMDTELNDSIHMALPMFDQDTLVVGISFPDYYFMTDKIAEYARKEGCVVLAITDSFKASIVQFAHRVLTVRSSTRLFLNTLSTPMALINALGSALDIITSYRKDERALKTERFDQLFTDKS